MISTPAYQTAGAIPPATVADAVALRGTPSGPYLNLSEHDAEVLRVRAIAPEVAAARGTRTQGNRMVIPLHNTQGLVEGTQYRPHRPTTGPDGKVRKYLFAKGARMILDVHPWSAATLHEREAPVLITESALKADATISAAIASEIWVCVLSIAGVSGWRSDKLPLPDFGDVRWDRRTVLLAFDSDAATNPNVARSRYELASFLRRKGARVLVIDVPSAENGDKQGMDDALAAGHTLPDLIASAIPASTTMPNLVLDAVIRDPQADEVERLRAENAQLQQQVSAQAQLIRNPDLTNVERMVMFTLVTETAAAQGRGEVDDAGRVRHRASTLCRDFRKKPAKGERWAEVNPDGTKPLTRRDNVKGLVKKFAEILPVTFEPTTRTDAEGNRFTDINIVMGEVDPLAAIIDLAEYRTGKTRKPYTKQDPCPHCGEVHERTVIRQTICGTEDDPGCGSILQETVITLPVPVASDPDATDDERTILNTIVAADPPK